MPDLAADTLDDTTFDRSCASAPASARTTSDRVASAHGFLGDHAICKRAGFPGSVRVANVVQVGDPARWDGRGAVSGSRYWLSSSGRADIELVGDEQSFERDPGVGRATIRC